MIDTPPPEAFDFADPLGVLRACHARILAHCNMLEQLVPHIGQQGVDEEARRAINTLVHYFSTGAAQHYRDKQTDLFPVLNRQSLKLADIIHRLRVEHEQLDSLWNKIEKDLKTPASLADNSAFSTQVEQFCSGYRKHIAYEDKELLGIAQHILSQRQLEELGKSMARRRGVRH